MTAELFQMIRAAAESLYHMEPANAAGRALAVAVPKSDDHCGTIEPLDNARRDDAQYPWVPPFSSEHKRVAVSAVCICTGLGQRLLQHFGLDDAAFAIVLIQLLRDSQRDFAGISRSARPAPGERLQRPVRY